MKMVKCRNGHVYDADKLKYCPHCQGIVKNLDAEPDSYGRGQAEVQTEVSSVDETRNSKIVGNRRNVGLLVETRGNSEGRAYILYEGVNRIGRAGNLEISLPNEDTVSRTGHVEITYDDGCYEMIVSKDTGMVYVNDKCVIEPTLLGDRDVVKIGECVFSFIKFDDVY